MTGVQFPEVHIFPFRNPADTVIIVNSVSYSKAVMKIVNNYAANKTAGASIWILTSPSDEVQQSHTLIRLYCAVLMNTEKCFLPTPIINGLISDVTNFRNK
jgi:hypothetical protein